MTEQLNQTQGQEAIAPNQNNTQVTTTDTGKEEATTMQDQFSAENIVEQLSTPPAKGKDDDDDDMSAEDRKLLDARVAKKMGPLQEQLQNIQQTQRITDFFGKQENEHLRPYEQRVRDVLSHVPALRNIKIEFVAYMVAGKDLYLQGAAMARSTDAAQAQTMPIGVGVPIKPRDGKNPLDTSGMNDQQFAAYLAKVRSGQ